MPKTPAPPKVTVSIRLTKADNDRLEAYAAAEQMPKAELAREYIRAALHNPFGSLDENEAVTYVRPQIRIRREVRGLTVEEA